MKQCFSRRVGGEECVAVKRGADLENGGTNLELRLPRGRALEEAGPRCASHPVPVESEDASTLFLDYWWYLPDNPTGSGGGAFCGPGLVIPGISCFDHESDWEGSRWRSTAPTPGECRDPCRSATPSTATSLATAGKAADGGLEG